MLCVVNIPFNIISCLWFCHILCCLVYISTPPRINRVFSVIIFIIVLAQNLFCLSSLHKVAFICGLSVAQEYFPNIATQLLRTFRRDNGRSKKNDNLSLLKYCFQYFLQHLEYVGSLFYFKLLQLGRKFCLKDIFRSSV